MKKPVPIFAPRLKKGDHLRVIAPAESFSPKFTDKMKEKVTAGMQELGLRVTFGNYVHEKNSFNTATIEHRLEDLHRAFSDNSVDIIMPATGGASANQLLEHIDYELIKKNPKIFCGLSDITELNSAIFEKTGLVTYYGPHFTMLGASQFFPKMLENMRRCFFSKQAITVKPSRFFSNSEWDNEKILNSGFWTLRPGKAEGTCMGGNLLTLNFLLGYEFMSDFENCILFLEENKVIDFRGIQKEVQQIINHPSGKKLKGIIFGRFQRESKMSRKKMEEMVSAIEELQSIPVIANVECSHTTPMMTFPYGGRISMDAEKEGKVELVITHH